MNNYYDNFRRLTCDVENLERDGRKRDGANAVAMLKQGTALYEHVRSADRFSPGVVCWDGGSVFAMSRFGAALLKNSVVCAAESWRERVRFSVGNMSAEKLLDQLVASGVITAKQIEDAARDVEQQEEEASAQ